MDMYFRYGEQHLKDSMTEPEFRKVLNYDYGKDQLRPYFGPIFQSLVEIS
jgi:hypothetical protein